MGAKKLGRHREVEQVVPGRPHLAVGLSRNSAQAGERLGLRRVRREVEDALGEGAPGRARIGSVERTLSSGFTSSRNCGVASSACGPRPPPPGSAGGSPRSGG